VTNSNKTAHQHARTRKIDPMPTTNNPTTHHQIPDALVGTFLGDLMEEAAQDAKERALAIEQTAARARGESFSWMRNGEHQIERDAEEHDNGWVRDRCSCGGFGEWREPDDEREYLSFTLTHRRP
jgi:hypothetical protein